MLGFCFPSSVWQASRSTYRDYCLFNLKHLIGIEVCDYFGMQTNVGILIEVYSFGKVCGHIVSFHGGRSVASSSWSKEAER